MNDQRRYKYLVLGRDKSYFVKTTLILPMIRKLKCSAIDLLFFVGHVFQDSRHTFVLIDTNCAPVLADLLFYSYKKDFIQGLLKKKLTRSFNFTFRYIDDVISLNNSRYCDLVLVADRSASYIELHLEIDDENRLFKNETLQQRRRIQFSHCEPSIYM